MNADLPDVLYIQPGKVGDDDLFVNKTPNGVMSRHLGTGFTTGARVGVYRLERVTKFGVGIVEMPTTTAAAAPVATTANT
jgi:hypothetical protein